MTDLLVNTSGTECATVAIGASCELSGSYTVTQADVDAGKVVNKATARAAELVFGVSRTVETAVAQERELGLAVTAETESYYRVGEELSYRYEVSNTGTVTLSGTVTIGDDTVAAGDIECAAVPEGGLGPGGTVSCTGTYAVDQGDVDAGAVTNRATATLNGVTSAAATATVSWVRSRDPQDNNDPPPENGNPPPDVPTLSVTGATVGEDGGSVTLAVSLAPTTVQTVQVTYATGDVTATAGEDYTAARGRLTFTPRLGSQAITVALSDDAVDESDETFTVELSLPANSQIGTGTATVTITDDDTRGLKVKPEALRVEEGDTSKYTVELATQPTGEVTVAMGTDLAGTDVTVDEASLTFTTGNWSTAQTVAVTAAEDDDGVADAAVELTHTASGGDYGSESATVTVTIAEDDRPAVVLSKSAVSVEEGAAGGSTYTVKLATQPTATVMVAVTGTAGNDVAVDRTSLTFTTGNWSTAQAVKVTAAEDADAVTDAAVELRHAASGGDYNGKTALVTVRITEDDTPGLVLSESAVSVEEGDAGGATYTVKLATQPSDEVTVSVTGTAGNDVAVDRTSLAFTTGNWSTAQTVKVTAAEDADAVTAGGRVW